MPFGQRVQLAAVALLTVPALHSVHFVAPRSDMKPEGHGEHRALPAPLKYPAGHSEHEEEPLVVATLPAPHTRHADAPRSDMKPAGHDRHVEAIAYEYCPLSQAVQTSESAGEKWPLGQGKQLRDSSSVDDQETDK